VQKLALAISVEISQSVSHTNVYFTGDSQSFDRS